MLCDYLVHTNFSDDSEYIMEEVVTDAIKMGMNEICFTDHVDYGIKLDWEQLDKIKEDGKGIEINTSSHRYGLNDLTPSREILKVYKELDGKIITIGSDSHAYEDLGSYIEEIRLELKKFGFKYYCTFENMKPIYHEL